MQQRYWRWIGVFVALTLLLLAGASLNTFRHWEGVAATIETPAERRAKLAPFWRMVPPAIPVAQAEAMLLSGCDGVHDNLDYWAGVLEGRGHPGLIIDSHTPRGLDKLQSWRLLCMGQVLPGAQRAGDLAVAMAASQQDDVILLGASHGGWSVLEFLGQVQTGTLPPGLTAWPAPPESLYSRVGATIVFYPYCGMLNGADRGDWSDAPPILMILGEKDELRLTPACRKMAADLRARGADIELIVYTEAGHGFEQQERAPLSQLTFLPAHRADATRQVEDFLSRHGL
ncbi:MAG: dienelactone hydrolase family protein [Paracoccus sp. (in: a-proteobacteria)]